MGQPRFTTVGPLSTANPANIRTASAFTSGLLTLDGVLVSSGIATLDSPRRVLFTFAADETANDFVVVGTDWSDATIGETVPGATAGTIATVLDYKTVVSITAFANGAGNLSIGTNAVSGSAWVKFESYVPGGVAFQCTVTGTVNYTVQQTLDDPSNPVSPVLPQNMTWLNCADAEVAAATASAQSNYQFAPVFVRVVLNSGTGSVAATFIQHGE